MGFPFQWMYSLAPLVLIPERDSKNPFRSVLFKKGGGEGVNLANLLKHWFPEAYLGSLNIFFPFWDILGFPLTLGPRPLGYPLFQGK